MLSIFAGSLLSMVVSTDRAWDVTVLRGAEKFSLRVQEQEPILTAVERAGLFPGSECNAWLSGRDYHPHSCDNQTGLPWLCHDGFANPINADLDAGSWAEVANAVPTLALSAFLTDNVDHARRAANLTRTWFLDPETAMRPNIDYSQAIPGLNNGTHGGLKSKCRVVVREALRSSFPVHRPHVGAGAADALIKVERIGQRGHHTCATSCRASASGSGRGRRLVCSLLR